MAKTREATSLVRNRSFLALWLGQLISSLGDHLLHINAIAFVLMAHRAAGGAMAQVLIWATIPGLLIGLVAGVVVDRANRKWVMVISDLSRAAMMGLLPLAAQQGFGWVCVVIGLMACASTFFGPARTALIPTAVRPEQLVAANAWFAASGFLTALVGTVIGSWILIVGGTAMSLWINTGVFACSALAISMARIQDSRTIHAHIPGPREALEELRTGWRLIVRHRVMKALVVHYAVLMAIASSVYVGIVGIAGHQKGSAMQGMSWLLTAAVVGIILGGLLAHRLSQSVSLKRLMAMALGCLVVGAFGMAVSDAHVALMVWVAVIGMGAAMYASILDASLQQLVPDALRGRVIATRGVGGSLAVLASSASAGWLIDHAGQSMLFGLIAAIALGGMIVMAVLSRPGLLFQATRWVLRQVGFAYFHLDLSGLQHIPTKGPAIIAGNHPSVLDGILLLIVSPRPVRFLIAEEFFFHPYLHWLFRGMGCIPVYRTRTHNGDALHAAIEALQRGEVIGIFPEGTTSYLGRLPIMKRGVALLALRTGAPVIPCGIWGSAEAYPQGARVPQPRRVTLSFGSPARYTRTLAETIPDEMLDRVLEDIRSEILRVMRWSIAALEVDQRPWQWKPLQIALSSLVVLPLVSFLHATSNHSLDPVS